MGRILTSLCGLGLQARGEPCFGTDLRFVAARGNIAARVAKAAAQGQRHLFLYRLQPVAALLSEEATAKLGQPVMVDVMQPHQASDAVAHGSECVVHGLAQAKEAGVDVDTTLGLVGWSPEG